MFSNITDPKTTVPGHAATAALPQAAGVKRMPAVPVLKQYVLPVTTDRTTASINTAMPIQRQLWQGAAANEWVDDRNNSSWLTELESGLFQDHYTGATYAYKHATDQFQVYQTTMYFDPATERILDKIAGNRYIYNGQFYEYDDEYYRPSINRLHSFNIPQQEAIRSDQIDSQPPVKMDLYGLEDAQVAAVLFAPDGARLKDGTHLLDRKGVKHDQEGRYTIQFEIFYAVGKSTIASYQYDVHHASSDEQFTSDYEVSIYLGSHWTTSRYDTAFFAGDLRDDVNIDAQLGEGLYLTEDRRLGLKAGWSTLMRDKEKPPPAAVVEWKIYKKKGIELADLATAGMPQELNWKAMPWRRDVQGGSVLRNYDTITKPVKETETKLNPRAFRKVTIVQGERLVIKDHLSLFQKVQEEMGQMLLKTQST